MQVQADGRDLCGALDWVRPVQKNLVSLRELERVTWILPFETQKFAKSSAKISIFFSIFQEDWQTKIFAKIFLMKLWSNGQHIDLRCRRSVVQSRATSSFFSYFIKILVFPLYFASITSSISMLMLDYPLRVIQKRLKAVIQNFLCYYQISSLLGFVD